MIIGHHKQKKILERLKKNPPHAFLFCGPEKVGKKSLALYFLKLINCVSGDVCGKCNNCLQIEKGVHSDLLVISPEKGEIHIDQIEELISKVLLRSSFAKFKAAIIDEAHLMNAQAQNSLLKTLEEPSGDTVIILVSENPSLLLPTISSRVFRIKFSFVSEDEIYASFGDVARFSFGRPGVAVDYLRNEEKRKEKEEISREFKKILQGDLSLRFKKIKELVKREDIKEIMMCWLDLLRKDFLDKVNHKKNTEDIKKMIEELESVIILNRRTSINIQLALEKIMIKI